MRAEKDIPPDPQTLGEQLLLKFCRPVNSPAFKGGPDRTDVSNALDFLIRTIPGFLDSVRGKDVLDFGCGFGNQAAALAKTAARSVTGLDLPRPVLQASWGMIPNF